MEKVNPKDKRVVINLRKIIITAIVIFCLILPYSSSAAEEDNIDMEIVRERQKGWNTYVTYKFTLNNLDGDKFVLVELTHASKKGKEVKHKFRSGTINGKNIVHVYMDKGLSYTLDFYSLKYTGDMFPKKEYLFSLHNFRP